MKTIIFGGDSDIARAIEGATYISHQECDVNVSSMVDLEILKHDPDVVVNCAGISIPGTIEEQTYFDWRRQIETNLFGSYNIARCLTKKMIAIFIASVAGMYGKPNHSAYSVSKSGVITLVQSLGKEGYQAYAVSPGRVDTKMREHDYPGEDKRTRLTPKQVASVVYDCIKGRYKPGDNIVYRKRGYRVLRRVDKGQPWRKYLNLW